MWEFVIAEAFKLLRVKWKDLYYDKEEFKSEINGIIMNQSNLTEFSDKIRWLINKNKNLNEIIYLVMKKLGIFDDSLSYLSFSFEKKIQEISYKLEIDDCKSYVY